jgi:hypothetical protein
MVLLDNILRFFLYNILGIELFCSFESVFLETSLIMQPQIRTQVVVALCILLLYTVSFSSIVTANTVYL